MTRYARAGKGTHQRVAKDSTPWNELKPPKPQRVRGGDGNGTRNEKHSSKGPANKSRKERFTKGGIISDGSSTDPNEGSSSEGKKHSGRNSNIRGYGQSKSVKIFGQFWVPADEAKRLKSLLKKLKLQGLPRKEILESLKNERRKAEKAAKRQRDKTCFQCRQFGHILSDCPNLKKAIALPGKAMDDAPDDSSEQSLVCFKCGSTEHTSRNCRKKGETFDFAKCFVCSGTGHIARQCPKNSKGIYPTGGSCSECGATTHLKKDCPDLVVGEPQSSEKDDAVTMRNSDPFASTEYEPVFEETTFDQVDQECDSPKGVRSRGAGNHIPPKSEPTRLSKKSKNKKIKKDLEGDAGDMYDIVERNVPTTTTLPFQVTKKRKVVKF